MVAELIQNARTYFSKTSLQRAIHEFLVSLFLLTLPFYVPAPRNIAWVVIGVNAFVALIRERVYKSYLKKYTKLLLLLSIFLSLHFLGMLYTENTSWGWFLVGLLVPVWVLPLAIVVFPMNDDTLKIYLRLFVVGVWVFVLLCYGRAFYRFWQGGAGQWFEYFFYTNFTAFGSEPTYLAILLCLVGLFLLIDLFFEKFKLFSRKIALVGIVFTGATMVFVSARMQIGILLLGIGIFFFEYFRRRGQFGKGILWGAVGVALLFVTILLVPYTRMRFSILWNRAERIRLDKQQDHSLGRFWDGATLRFAQWTCAQELIRRHWLWGVGTGDGQDELQKIYEEFKFYFASRYNRYNAHNQFFEIWIALGIWGLLSWLALFLVPLPIWLKSKNYFALVVWGVLFFSAFTESYLQRNYGAVIFALFYGMAWNKKAPEK